MEQVYLILLLGKLLQFVPASCLFPVIPGDCCFLEIHADCSWSQSLLCCKLLCLGLLYITIIQYKRSVVSCHALFKE